MSTATFANEITITRDVEQMLHVATHGTLMDRIRLASNPRLSREAEQVLRQSPERLIHRALDTMLYRRGRRLSLGVAVPFECDLPAGSYFDADLGRCARCDSRYCVDYCHAGEPGYVYVTSRGWVTWSVAREVVQHWRAQGLDFGPHHPLRRVEILCSNDCCINKLPITK